MAQVSPPKPWEKRGGMPAAAAPSAPPLSVGQVSAPPPTIAQQSAMSSQQPATATASGSSAPPALPSRPAALANATAATATGYSPYNNRQVGAYGGLNGGLTGGLGGGYGYSSPYGGFGSMGGYGGYGGGMYGRMGGMGGYGGYGGYGGGGYGGMGGDPNDPNSLMRGMENSTAATFQLIESIVGAFGGFAQMLESTFMATHSSFFAMVQVAEQFGNLRNTLGQILGIFTVMRWARIAFAKLTGRPLPASAGDLNSNSFAAFAGPAGGAPGAPGARARPSKKPFFFFVLAVFGLPYLMGKLIRSLAAKQEEDHKRQMAAAGMIDPATGQLVGQAAAVDPSNLEFARVKFDYTPENSVVGVDLEVKKNDLVAILSKSDPMGQPSQWWRCRARDSRMGYLPAPYLEVIVKKPKAVEGVKGEAGTVSTDVSRAATMNSTVGTVAPALGTTKPGDISLESFQKSQFFS